MKTRKYRPPPLRPPEPEPVAEPAAPWRASAREWLDLVDHQGHAVASFDGWSALVAKVRGGDLRAGWYILRAGDGVSVASISIDGGGGWRMHGVMAKKRG